ncbi:hypothetical protein EXIGLDRAFT_176239 [Exidia glandulosa HHB12029]|uniref:Uncharacterized protein n=1 Tax=Exidia glandulosa HHB12029 TaxID=1314781 RepID=A0A165N1Y1_EXIGL|nr:hypothetical protein EXIGLDRAFT_176239 [Exidia glandulosa HHB12029]
MRALGTLDPGAQIRMRDEVTQRRHDQHLPIWEEQRRRRRLRPGQHTHIPLAPRAHSSQTRPLLPPSSRERCTGRADLPPAAVSAWRSDTVYSRLVQSCCGTLLGQCDACFCARVSRVVARAQIECTRARPPRLAPHAQGRWLCLNHCPKIAPSVLCD